VVESDNEKAIGTYIWVPKKWTVKMPESTVSNERDLLTLIDLALLTKDEQWFMELSSNLVSTKNNPEVNTKKSEFLMSQNRIRNSEAKR